MVRVTFPLLKNELIISSPGEAHRAFVADPFFVDLPTDLPLKLSAFRDQRTKEAYRRLASQDS